MSPDSPEMLHLVGVPGYDVLDTSHTLLKLYVLISAVLVLCHCYLRLRDPARLHRIARCSADTPSLPLEHWFAWRLGDLVVFVANG